MVRPMRNYIAWVHDGVVLDREPDQNPRRLGLHLAELLHDLDESNRLPGRDGVAFIDVGLPSQARFAIKNSGKR